MSRKRTAKTPLLPPVIFDAKRLPPRKQIEIKYDIDTIGIRNCLEYLQLHSLDNGGAVFYYPDDEHTKCRFEWHRRWRRNERALRVGIIISVGTQGKVLQVTGYVADSRVFENEDFGPPNLTNYELKRITKSLNVTFQNSLAGVYNGEERYFYLPYYIKGPFIYQTNSPVQFDNGAITLGMIRLFEGKMIAPIIIKMSGVRREITKIEADERIHFFCAVLSLLLESPVDLETHRWPSGFQPPEEVSDASKISTLYPKGVRADLGQEGNLEKLKSPVDWVLSSFETLDIREKDILRNSLLAYWSELRLRVTEPTLSSVPMLAALSAMSQERTKRCRGGLTCSVCGTLSGSHNLIGERQAIVESLVELFSLSPDDSREINKLIGSLYGGQRSAYVHAAELRHQEHKGNRDFPIQMPTDNHHHSQTYQLNQQLRALNRITRMAIIRWLGNKSGHEPDPAQWNISGWTLFPSHGISAIYHTSSRWWTRIG